MDDDDVHLVRLALWTAFACATQTVSDDPEAASGAADSLLENAEARFPFLKAPPTLDPLDLV